MLKPEDHSKIHCSELFFLIHPAKDNHRILVNVKDTPTGQRQQQSGTAQSDQGTCSKESCIWEREAGMQECVHEKDTAA